MGRIDWKIAAAGGAALGAGIGGFAWVQADSSPDTLSPIAVEPSERTVRALSSPVSIPETSGDAPDNDQRDERRNRTRANRDQQQQERPNRRPLPQIDSVSPLGIDHLIRSGHFRQIPSAQPSAPNSADSPDSPASSPTQAPAPAPQSPPSPDSPPSYNAPDSPASPSSPPSLDSPDT